MGKGRVRDRTESPILTTLSQVGVATPWLHGPPPCVHRLRGRPEEDEDRPEDRPLLPDEDRGGGDERTVRPLDPLLRDEGAERTVRPLDPLLPREEGVERTAPRLRLPEDDEDRDDGDERTVRPLDPLLLREEGVERTVRPLDPLLLREEGDERTVRPLDPLLLREEGVERTVRPLDPLLPREEGVEPTVRPVLRVVVARRVSRAVVPVDLPVPDRFPCTVDDLPERAERSPETVEAPRVFPAETLPAVPTSRIPLPPKSPVYPPRAPAFRPIEAPRGPHCPPLERIAPG